MNAPRFEIVQTDDGFHARTIAENGEKVLWSEVHPDRRDARNAIRITAQLFSVTPVFFDFKAGVMYVNAAGMKVELRDVDERTPAPAPLVAEPPYYLGTYLHYSREGRRTESEQREFWHDRDYHWRQCVGDECSEGTPPAGVEVRVRFGVVTYGGGA